MPYGGKTITERQQRVQELWDEGWSRIEITEILSDEDERISFPSAKVYVYTQLPGPRYNRSRKVPKKRKRPVRKNNSDYAMDAVAAKKDDFDF